MNKFDYEDNEIVLGNVFYLIGAIFTVAGLLIMYAAYTTGDTSIMLKAIFAYLGIQAACSFIGSLFGLIASELNTRGFVYWLIAWGVFYIMLLTSYSPLEAFEDLLGLSVVPYLIGLLLSGQLYRIFFSRLR